MSDHMSEIENRKAQQDVGGTLVNFFTGALAESDSWVHAFWATVAFGVALLKQEPTDG